MNNNDAKNAKLVRKSIEDVRSVLLGKKIEELKIAHIISATNLSRSKFFSFFGSINIVLELVISEELISCYELISQNLSIVKDKDKVLNELNLQRVIYFRKNPILFNYYQNISHLPQRYNPLKEAISVKERDLQISLFEDKGIKIEKVKDLKIL